MITKYHPSDVNKLNESVEKEKWIHGIFQIIENNVAYESIPCKSLWVERRYEVVQYPGGRKGVQFLGKNVETVLLKFPETQEGEKQVKELGLRVEEND